MKQIVETSTLGRGRGAHYHLAYLNDEAGTGAASVSGTKNDKHSHKVRFVPPTDPTPEELDEFGNVIQEAQEGTPGHFELLPAADGHTHDLYDETGQLMHPEVTNPFEDDRDDDEIISEVVQLFKAATEIEADSIDEGECAEEFAAGFQWTDEEIQAMKDDERAYLTINYIEPNVDDLCGFQRNQRTDFLYSPQEASDQKKADIFNIVARHICQQSNYETQESEFFEDMAVAGRGIMDLDVDFDRNIEGDIVIRHRPWKDRRLGPHKQKDLSDLEYSVDFRMFSGAQLKRMFQDKEEEIDASLEQLTMLSDTDDRTSAEDAFSKQFPSNICGLSTYDIALKQLMVLECWRKMFIRESVIVNPADEFYLNALGWKKSDIDAAGTIPGFRVVERTGHKMRITKVCRGVLLSDECPADLPVDDFYFTVGYCKKRGDRFWGKVKRAIDPQRELNKRRSQAMDFANRALGVGHFYDDQTFPDGGEKKFKQVRARSGWLVKIQDVNNPPHREEAPAMPEGIIDLAGMSQQTIKDLMSVQVEPGGANDSGTKLLTLQQDKLRGNEFLFDNLSLAKRRIGRLLLGLIPRYYSPERVSRIVMSWQSRQKAARPPELQPAANPDAPAPEDFTIEDIMSLYAETDVGTLDIITTEGAYSPTQKAANLLMMKEVSSVSPFPQEVYIDQMEMPEAEKRRALDAIARQAQAQSEAAQSTADAEIEKTLIGQGYIPPAVAERFQIQVPGAQAPGVVQGGLGEQPLPVTGASDVGTDTSGGAGGSPALQ